MLVRPNVDFCLTALRFTYHSAGGPTSMQFGNGRWESTTFNSRLQPTQIALGTIQNGYDQLKLQYSYGDWNGASIDATKNNGNIVQHLITVPTVGASTGFVATQKYYYDSLNRIDDATEDVLPNGGTSSQSWRQDFSYDRYGNRNFVEANTSFAGFDKLCNSNTELCADLRKKLNPSFSTAYNQFASGQNYGYDASGNTTGDPSGRTFVYDGENKQVKVLDAQQAVIGEYYYDGDGKRVKKYVPDTGEYTIFVYGATGKLVAEYSTQVASQQNAKVAYLTNDHLGSPRINTDQNGSVTARHDYHPFGEEIDGSGGRTTGLNYGDDSVRKQFTGYERDNETELDFAQDRFYASKLGRFLSTDNVLISEARVFNPQIWNSYSYVGNNPLKYSDPSGMERIQLGRSEDDIQKDIESKKAKKKELEEQKKALKQEGKTLSKEEYSRKESALKDQINQTNSSISTLNTELNGTKIINAMLDQLNKKGLANGLKLSDLSVSTDPENDFTGLTFPAPISEVNAFVVQKSDGTGPDYGGQIFINAKGPLYNGALNGGLDGTTRDWILYGASTLRHEQWHRDAPTDSDRRSERLAYQTQLPILRSFEHSFSSASFYKNRINYVTQRAR